MGNPFISAGDNFYAEQYNGAISLFALGNPELTLELPADYDKGVFLDGSNKCAFSIVKLIMVDTEIYDNTIRLQEGKTRGTATFRVYPNIEPLKKWVELLFTTTNTTGTVTCNILKDNGATLVKENVDNPEDLTDEAIGLEYVDFKFTLIEDSGDRPTLDTIEITLEGGV